MTGAGGGKGVNPLKGLRGITEADFFQKYTTSEKGLTFNYEGALIAQRKPKNLKVIAEKMGYAVDENINKISNTNLKKDRSKYSTQQNSRVFGGHQSFDDTVQTHGTTGGVKRQDTYTESHDNQALGKFGQGTKADVIESNYTDPNKVMTIASGVELIEKGKITAGGQLSVPNKIKLSDYNKMKDPRQQ